MKTRICIFGHFDEKNHSASGAVVKATELSIELVNIYGVNLIRKVDIFDWRHHILSVLFKIVLSFFSSSVVIVVGSNTDSRLLALFKVLKKLSKTKLCFVVVGASIADSLKKHSDRIPYLNCIDCFFVETEDVVEDLKQLGIKNVNILRNFKHIEIPIKETNRTVKPVYNYIVLSRLNRYKGITDAIRAITAINNEGYCCHLDIYGPIEPGYENELNDELKRSVGVSYKGIVDSNRASSIIADYYCLLFPTYYETEGIPGTIVDSLAAGVPIISSDFPRRRFVFTCDEGLVYEFKSFNGLKKALVFSIEHPEIIEELSLGCLKRYSLFLPEKAILPLKKFINDNCKNLQD